MLKRPKAAAGTLVVLEHVSKILKGNPLGDPHVRKVGVWLPPHYDWSKKRFPVLYDLVGFTGSGLAHTSFKSFGDNVPERAARLIHDGKMAPCVIVFPDCFTALGGNQYVNSTAIGDYADYLTREIIPFVDREFRTLAAREHRGCFGKSSGGYGAMIHGMQYAQHWGAIADHSGDAYFDFVYWHDWPNTLNELAKHRAPKQKAGAYDARKEARRKELELGKDDGRIRRFLQHVWKKEKVSGKEVHALMNLCMAATYDPDPRAPNGFRIPFNAETGEPVPGRWKNWQKHDPINLIARYRRNLKTLRGIYIDCGWKDQYHIQYGSRILSRRLAEAGIRHRYEEFDDDHSDIDYRMDVSLPFLANALR
ncbi:MAG: alpha/beta hydrolase-fold protein [Betaproteobacteria bacterium]|nr:alpha/beta hydrolase-fold protein [Betaproteobacteria bacterium]MDH5221905.1 alpha/beta hydrolase-fold protein [Betaproteobacteria bacterium]MDH5352434.1 alpha/beta hydrolase-fold protein [Betaproteobacteria bacterium]